MKSKTRLIILFLLPAGILYGGFFLLPTAWSFYYSAFDFSGFGDAMKFVGFDNFKSLAIDPVFWMSLRNSLYILLVGGIVTFGLAFMFSVMINAGIKGKRFFRAALFLPNVISTVALTTLWSVAVFGSRTGILPNGLKALGLVAESKYLWTAPEHVFNTVMIAIVWINVGYYVVLILAGMDKIPGELYEAARIEGASQPRVFFGITVPLIWDVIVISFVTWGIGALKVFEFPFAFMGANEDPNLYTLNIYLYIMGFGKRMPIFRLGYATAIGVVLVLLALVFNWGLRRVMRRDSIQY
jgi:ABC-type sugar transport system permease subunit